MACLDQQLPETRIHCASNVAGTLLFPDSVLKFLGRSATDGHSIGNRPATGANVDSIASRIFIPSTKNRRLDRWSSSTSDHQSAGNLFR